MPEIMLLLAWKQICSKQESFSTHTKVIKELIVWFKPKMASYRAPSLKLQGNIDNISPKTFFHIYDDQPQILYLVILNDHRTQK